MSETRCHTRMLPDPFCSACDGSGWTAGGSYMGEVERIPCDCYRPREDEDTPVSDEEKSRG